MIKSLLLSLFAPAVVDIIQRIFSKIFKLDPGPVSVEDQVKLLEARSKLISSLSQLDNPGGTPSKWIVDLRASVRYIIAILVILFTLFYLVFGKGTYAAAFVEMTAIIFGFFFGERFYLKITNKGN